VKRVANNAEIIGPRANRRKNNNPQFINHIEVYDNHPNPKYPVPGCQQRALGFSLKRCDLHSQCCVLDGNGLMSAKEQSDESEYRQKKDCHVSDSFHPSTCQSTRYERLDIGKILDPECRSALEVSRRRLAYTDEARFTC
jgi:hypothetical protein